MANMTGLIAGRDAILKQDEYQKGVVYISEQSHSSNRKGIRLIGFRDDQIVMVPTDEEFKIKVDVLEDYIKRDIADGKIPAIIIGNLGSTNTGEIDDFDKLGALAKKYNIWLHADGAYGGSILLSDRYRHMAAGIENVDSLSWDMHKWLMQCYSCSAVIVKNGKYMFDAFNAHHEYLDDATIVGYHDPWDMGPEMSRPHRVIQFWITLQAVGLKEIKKSIDTTCEFVEL